jgi:hypothetical protein
MWLASAVFVGIFTVMVVLGSDHPYTDGLSAAILYAIAAMVIVRLGLLALAVGIFLDGLLMSLPVSLNTSAWYFSDTTLALAGVVAMAAWGFWASISGRKLLRQDLFG